MSSTPYQSIINKLKQLETIEIKLNVPLKKYTTLKVGGPADIFVIPETIFALKKTLQLIENYDVPLFILGKGSNIIVSDKGFRGIIISMEKLDRIKIANNMITAECGISLSSLAAQAAKAGLSGLEFASGIPGTLGGALYMNAGAYKCEMKDILKKATVVNYSGQEVTLHKKQLNLSYRHSILQEKPLIAVKAKMKLTPGSKEKIKAEMNYLNQKRREKQPLNHASAGSTFKRPAGHYAGTLIEETGLKGLQIGGAQVSQKHAGFIINTGNASARDIKGLIKKVQTEVYKYSGIKLHPEPKFLGEFEE